MAFALTPNAPTTWKLAWLLFCMTVQIGTNLHNDYSDYVQGADHPEHRVGHKRATAQGWLSPTTTCRAATGVLTITFLLGVYLVAAADQWNNWFAWFLVGTSVFNAFAYTGGPYPLGLFGWPPHWSIAYAGLGEIFVLLYFGYVAVLMLPYLLSKSSASDVVLDWPRQWLYSTAVGLLATNILVVNNLRDRQSDVLVHKRTTAVRFGRLFGLWEYTANVLGSFVVVIVYEGTQAMNGQPCCWSTVVLLLAVSLPLALFETKAVWKCPDGPQWNPHVGAAAGVQFVFCILVHIGMLYLS